MLDSIMNQLVEESNYLSARGNASDKLKRRDAALALQIQEEGLDGDDLYMKMSDVPDEADFIQTDMQVVELFLNIGRPDAVLNYVYAFVYGEDVYATNSFRVDGMVAKLKPLKLN